MKLNSNLVRLSNSAQPPKTEKERIKELEQKLAQPQQTSADVAAMLKSAKQAMDMLEYQGVLNIVQFNHDETDKDDTAPDCKMIPPSESDAEDATPDWDNIPLYTGGELPSGVFKFRIDHKRELEDALANGTAHKLTFDEILLFPVEENKDKTLAELVADGKITELNKSRFYTVFESCDKVDQSIKDKIYHYTYEVADASDELEKILDELFEKYKDTTLGELLADCHLGEQYIFTAGLTVRESVERYGITE